MFSKERQLLADLETGIAFLSRKYSDTLKSLQSVTAENEKLRKELTAREERIRDLEEQLTFGKGVTQTSTQVGVASRLRGEIDELVAEVDNCLSLLGKNIPE